MMKKAEIRKQIASKEKVGFPCPFCGSHTTKAHKFYSSLTIILTMRFMGLLDSSNGQGHFEGVLDSIYQVFGIRNLVVREALKESGYLEKFDERFNIEEEEFAINCTEKQRCNECGNLKEIWEITVDKFGKQWEFICEGCLAKQQQSRKKKTAKIEGPINIITDRKKTPITWEDLLEDENLNDE